MVAGARMLFYGVCQCGMWLKGKNWSFTGRGGRWGGGGGVTGGERRGEEGVCVCILVCGVEG